MSAPPSPVGTRRRAEGSSSLPRGAGARLRGRVAFRRAVTPPSPRPCCRRGTRRAFLVLVCSAAGNVLPDALPSYVPSGSSWEDRLGPDGMATSGHRRRLPEAGLAFLPTFTCRFFSSPEKYPSVALLIVLWDGMTFSC